jgi:predicted nucleic acid-binding protein
VEQEPDDDKLFECAVALKAKSVITGDKAVKNVKDCMNIKVVNLTEFLRSIRESKRE